MPEKKAIKHWSEDERPREKFEKKGPEALSNAELLAILINTGTRDKTALDIAQELLSSVGQSLSELSRIPLPRLKNVKGIGSKKAVTLAAALELGRRRRSEEAPSTYEINNSRTAYEILSPHLQDQHVEKFIVCLLNNKNNVIRIEAVGQGGLSGVVADPKIIFKTALLYNATGLIVAHNHPSGQLKPSTEDEKLTHRLKESAEVLGIRFFDHLIITAHGYFSFADEGLLR